MKPFFGMLALVAMLLAANFGLALAQGPGQAGKANPAQKDAQPPKAAAVKAALVLNDPKAFQGVTLFSPMGSNKSYLIDMEGRVVHVWQGAGGPTMSAYLLPDGTVFRPTNAGAKGGKGVVAAGGRFQEIAWDGTVVWDYQIPNDKDIHHHDAIKLPNGNVLAIVAGLKSAEEANAAGRKGGGAMTADGLVEIKPRGKDGGDIVWQWYSWDHRIQDTDAAKPKYGKTVENPGLIDINAGGNPGGGVAKGKDDPGKGKDAPGKGDKGGKSIDWNHLNGLSYNPELDQVLVSAHSFSEFWIIDHTTTTAEAASPKGGKQGKGGDLLYRWGNPRTYGAGKADDQQLFFQHNAHWIPAGLPGAGNVLVFNNGFNRPGGAYSSVDEIVTPVSATGGYTSKPGTAYGPAKPAWSYTAEPKADFYGANISGAQRLPNGNTLICSGPSATIFEVTPAKEVVWKYLTPTTAGVPNKQGFGGSGSLFRANRFAPDHPAFVGKTLTPGSTLEELLLKDKKGK